jgi:hypothetical protein
MWENDSYMAPRLRDDEFFGKIVHSSCSGEDLDRINQLKEQENHKP